MANIASQKKRIARSARERSENLRFASTVKTHMKRLQGAVTSGDDAAADSEHRLLISKIDKAVQKGAMHRNTGARKKSRAARIRAGEVTLDDARPGKRKGSPARAAQPEAAEPAEAASEETADEPSADEAGDGAQADEAGDGDADATEGDETGDDAPDAPSPRA
jgi:small subunit ribosomal protein S20